MPRCPDIDNPDNGRIDFAPDSMAPFDNGTIATYDCDLGYQSEGGDRVRVCEENGFSEIGAWRGTAPVCAGMCSCVIFVSEHLNMLYIQNICSYLLTFILICPTCSCGYMSYIGTSE